MIFEIEVHNNSFVASLIGKYLVFAKNLEQACTKALKAAEKDNYDNKPIHVRSARVLDGKFIK